MCVSTCVCVKAHRVQPTLFASFDVCNSVNILSVVITRFLHIASLILYEFNGNMDKLQREVSNTRNQKCSTVMFIS